MATKKYSIVRGTTPTFIFTFSTTDVSTIQVAYLVIKQKGKAVIQLGFDMVDVGENTLSWTISQDDSLSLIPFESAEVYCDWLLESGIRGRSKVLVCTVEPAGMDEVIQ